MLRRDVGAFHHRGIPALFCLHFIFFFQAFSILLQAKKVHSCLLQVVSIITTVRGHTEVTFFNLCCRGSGWPHKLHSPYIYLFVEIALMFRNS